MDFYQTAPFRDSVSECFAYMVSVLEHILSLRSRHNKQASFSKQKMLVGYYEGLISIIFLFYRLKK